MSPTIDGPRFEHVPASRPSPFDYVAPTPQSVELIKTVRAAMKDAALEVIYSLPDCRERALALTKLEEASMWANKGIVFHQHEAQGEIIAGESGEE